MATEKEQPKQPKKTHDNEKIRKKSDWHEREKREKVTKLENPGPWPDPPQRKKS